MQANRCDSSSRSTSFAERRYQLRPDIRRHIPRQRGLNNLMALLNQTAPGRQRDRLGLWCQVDGLYCSLKLRV